MKALHFYLASVVSGVVSYVFGFGDLGSFQGWFEAYEAGTDVYSTDTAVYGPAFVVTFRLPYVISKYLLVLAIWLFNSWAVCLRFDVRHEISWYWVLFYSISVITCNLDAGIMSIAVRCVESDGEKFLRCIFAFLAVCKWYPLVFYPAMVKSDRKNLFWAFFAAFIHLAASTAFPDFTTALTAPLHFGGAGGDGTVKISILLALSPLFFNPLLAGAFSAVLVSRVRATYLMWSESFRERKRGAVFFLSALDVAYGLGIFPHVPEIQLLGAFVVLSACALAGTSAIAEIRTEVCYLRSRSRHESCKVSFGV